jgi:ribosomal protein L18E
LSVQLTVRAHKFSASARQKIEAAGGAVESLEPPTQDSAPNTAD